MAVFKCKMCGGDLDVTAGSSTGTCQYCGSTMTLPTLDDEKKINLYQRASDLRQSNDFDRAMEIYEDILREDPTDAEAYWSIVLCRYGIEYVEDPVTKNMVPTCNRTQFTSVFLDADYKKAIEYSQADAKIIYEQEAEAIDKIQKQILDISSKEKPFDVFICYKETDERGRRTQDSVLAQELYYELQEEGFKVFFAPITLEGKLGDAYEPYIFGALNSSKVMVVLGTSSENFNSVWVKNEWSRFLALMKNDKSKKLIPCYRDMDPYNLPQEFSFLQAQDISKLGFMQDLVRGISKLVGCKAEKGRAEDGKYAVDAENLLKRAQIHIEDGEFESADNFFEQALNIEPEMAEAYLGKLMVQLRIRSRADLAKQPTVLTSYSNFNKAVRFANDALKSELLSHNQTIIDLEEENRREKEAARQRVVEREQESRKEALVRQEEARKEVLARQQEERIRIEEDKKKGSKVKMLLILFFFPYLGFIYLLRKKVFESKTARKIAYVYSFFWVAVVIAMIFTDVNLYKEKYIDVMQFVSEDGKMATQQEVVAVMGEPQKVQNWQWPLEPSFEVVTITYERENSAYWQFSFVDNSLQRITFAKSDVKLEDIADVVEVLNCGNGNEYSTPKDRTGPFVITTGAVHEIQFDDYDEDEKCYTTVKVSYSDIFEQK